MAVTASIKTGPSSDQACSHQSRKHQLEVHKLISHVDPVWQLASSSIRDISSVTHGCTKQFRNVTHDPTNCMSVISNQCRLERTKQCVHMSNMLLQSLFGSTINVQRLLHLVDPLFTLNTIPGAQNLTTTRLHNTHLCFSCWIV